MNFSAALNRSIIHKRCGHRGWKLLKFMNRCECYRENGFRLDESEVTGDECLCEACVLSKINKRQNRKTVDRFKYSPGELWYADVSGPFEPSLIYRNIYKVVFVDSYTRLTVIDFIGSKDDKSILEVLSEFTKVHVAFALAQGVNPVFIQSDNGEFGSSKVKFFCISHGLVQRFSPPYHSITNGPVERKRWGVL